MTHSLLIDPTEIEAREQEEETEQPVVSEVPEKYKGKTQAEIIEMHQNAESELGRRANEVGHYRSLIDELISAKRTKDLKENQPEGDDIEVDINADALLTDPKGVLTRFVDSRLNKRVKPLESAREKDAALTEEQKFYSDYPDAEKIANDPEFHAFIKRTPSRQADAQRVVNPEGMDVKAARRLLEDYSDFKALQKPTNQTEEEEEIPDPKRSDNAPTGVDGARKVATERSGDSSPGRKKYMYQSEVVDLMIRNPDKYKSDSYQKELMTAIKEGRLRK